MHEIEGLPLRLPKKEYEMIERVLGEGTLTSPEGQFDHRGVFGLDLDSGDRGLYHWQLWSSDLVVLRPDPLRHRVSLKNGILKLGPTREGTHLPLPRMHIRFIDMIHSGPTKVRRGGVVLPDNAHYFLMETLKPDQLLEALDRVAAGKREDGVWNNVAIMKVDQEQFPVGTPVELIHFSHPLWHQNFDGVVIDPKTRQLVEREILYPFANPDQN